MPTVDELKPCPFCGGKARTEGAYILCSSCTGQVHATMFQTMPDAIAAWNRRALTVSAKFIVDREALRTTIRSRLPIDLRMVDAADSFADWVASLFDENIVSELPARDVPGSAIVDVLGDDE